MFKKKPVPEQSRARIRPQDQTTRNAAVFSYHANRSASLEGRERSANVQAQPKRRIPRFGLDKLRRTHVLSVLVILILFLLSVGLDSRPKVVVLGDASDRFALQDTKVYEDAARQMFGRSYTNNNKLTINTEAVAVELKRTFPEVHAVSISLPFIGRQPTVYIQPAIPQLVLATPHGQFILDSSGRALAEATPDTPMPKDRAVPTVIDQSGIDVRKGDVVLPSKSVAFIADVAAQLYAQKIEADTWTLPAQSSQLNVKMKGVPYFVKFNLQADGREEAGSYIAVRKELEGKREIPAHYIDVRVSGRAYYR
jgi:hypothetical protein